MCVHTDSVLKSWPKAKILKALATHLPLACFQCDLPTPPAFICVECFPDNGVLCHRHSHQHAHKTLYSLLGQKVICQQCGEETPHPQLARSLLKRGPQLWKGQRGLKNLGNTCYVNAALQCFLRCPGVWEYFSKVGRFYLDETRAFPLFRQIYELVDALTHSKTAVVPRDFIDTLYSEIPAFLPRQQQDAQEFLRRFIDYLDEALGGHSFFSTVFQGVLTQQRKCEDCGKVAVLEEPFFELQVPINEEAEDSGVSLLEEADRLKFAMSIKRHQSIFAQCLEGSSTGARTVYDCLNHLFTPAHLEGSQCDSCGCLSRSTLSYAIKQAPNVLVLVLKRFAFVRGRCKKIKTHVQLPLVLRPPSFRADEVYELTGVIEHRGSLHSGHYCAYFKSPLPNYWIRYNDKRLKYVSEAAVLNVQAYITFYSRQTVPLLEVSVSTPLMPVPKEWTIALSNLHSPGPLNYKYLKCPHNRKNPLAHTQLVEYVAETVLTQLGFPDNQIDKTFRWKTCKQCITEMETLWEQVRQEAREVDPQNAVSDSEQGYIVSQQWFQKWKHYITWSETCLSLPENPGPVTNSHLLQDGSLKSGAVQGTDYVLVNSAARKCFKEWHNFDYEVKKSKNALVTSPQSAEST